MPCNCDYMEASDKEIKLSQVACFLDELDGKPLDRKSGMRGYHRNIYNKGVKKEVADVMVKTLCDALQNTDVIKYSLEMQIWWRDHQEADRQRIEQELNQQADIVTRAEALKKLTPYERKLLGV